MTKTILIEKEQVIKAINLSHGLLTVAAKKLKVSRQVLLEYADRFPLVKECIQDNRESALDLAESKLFSEIKAGNMMAITFFLKTRGRDRGYAEKTETEVYGKGGGPIVIKEVEVRLDGRNHQTL